MEGLNPGYLRRPRSSSNSLITWHSVPAPWLRRCSTPQSHICQLVLGKLRQERAACGRRPFVLSQDALITLYLGLTCPAHASLCVPSSITQQDASCTLWLDSSTRSVGKKCVTHVCLQYEWIKMFCSWANKARTRCTQKVFHKVTR